jgi:hypothetical protein
MSAESQNWDSQLLLRNGSANTPTARLWSNKHLSATAVTSCNNTSRRAVVDGVFCDEDQRAGLALQLEEKLVGVRWQPA